MSKGMRVLMLWPVFIGGMLALVEAQEFKVDDSYTVTQRFEQEKVRHPNIMLPNIHFSDGQVARFDMRYKVVNGRELHADVFLPAPKDQQGQAFIFVHGGGWRSGNKSHGYALANRLVQRGYAVITVEYRLSIEAPFPAAVIDIHDAIVWFKSQALAWHIDPAHVALIGGSAGGHLASLVGLTRSEQWQPHNVKTNDTAVNMIIDLDGVLDFTTPLALQFENKRAETSAAALWLGAPYQKAPALWKQASPASYVTRNAPPMLVISSGQKRFTAGKENVEIQMQAHKIPFEFYTYKNVTHTFWLFEPYVSEVAERIDNFVRKLSKDTQDDD